MYLSSRACCSQEARIYCQEIRDTIKILKSNRDMAFNEIKLTVMIEDPRARERRENLGIEVRSMCICIPNIPNCVHVPSSTQTPWVRKSWDSCCRSTVLGGVSGAGAASSAGSWVLGVGVQVECGP